ncbi:MAG: hypothetical protein EOO77_17860, partial [Oxalobacteraceae bacterium]
MTEAVKLIKAVEATSGRLEKERLIRESFENGHREFFAAARQCLDPTLTYGMKKVTVLEDEGGGDLSFTDFMKFAERLRKRE